MTAIVQPQAVLIAPGEDDPRGLRAPGAPIVQRRNQLGWRRRRIPPMAETTRRDATRRGRPGDGPRPQVGQAVAPGRRGLGGRPLDDQMADLIRRKFDPVRSFQRAKTEDR